MRIRPSQVTFAGGEYSPFMYSRTDLQKYSSGLRTCKNFIVHPYGGASNRPGTLKVAETKDSTKRSKIRPFIFSESQAYALEVGHEYVRFFTDGDSVINAGVPYEVSTPYQEEDLASIKFDSSADVIYLKHPDYQPRTLSRYAENDWRLATYSPEDGPFMAENTDDSLSLNVSAVSGDSITVSATGAVFDATHVGALFKLRHYIQGQSVSTTFTGTGTSTAISCFTTWRVISHGTWTGKFKIEKSDDGGATWTRLREFSSAADYNASTFGTEDEELNTEPFLIRVNYYAHTSGSVTVDLSADPFYQDGICKVSAFSSDTLITASVLQSFGSTEATASWSEGSWSDYRGWPSDSVFIQDRIAFAGTASEPMGIWTTCTGNYVSFRRGINLLDTDGISIQVLSRQLNAINGLVALGELLVFTSSSEWKVVSDDSVMTPTTVSVRPQGYRGSSGLTPLVVGNIVLYMQFNGKVIRSFQYNYQTDSYEGSDLRILSEHLFNGHTIVEMAYQQDDDSIVWLLRDDGILIGMTYMPEQEVVAFHRHETDGSVESICVIPGDGFDELWMIVNRDNGRFVERMTQRVQSDEVMDNLFLDCAVTVNASATTIVSGVGHLLGMEVGIIGDGIVFPRQTVTGDSITLTQSCTYIACGLPYESDLETLNVEVGLRDGSTKGRKVKIGTVTFSLLNSRGGWVGSSEDNIYENFIPERTDVSVAADLFSGDVKVPLGSGYEDGGRIFLRQKDPLPITIISVTPDVSIE